jgi:hypothetical protein
MNDSGVTLSSCVPRLVRGSRLPDKDNRGVALDVPDLQNDPVSQKYSVLIVKVTDIIHVIVICQKFTGKTNRLPRPPRTAVSSAASPVITHPIVQAVLRRQRRRLLLKGTTSWA